MHIECTQSKFNYRMHRLPQLVMVLYSTIGRLLILYFQFWKSMLTFSYRKYKTIKREPELPIDHWLLHVFGSMIHGSVCCESEKCINIIVEIAFNAICLSMCVCACVLQIAKGRQDKMSMNCTSEVSNGSFIDIFWAARSDWYDHRPSIASNHRFVEWFSVVDLRFSSVRWPSCTWSSASVPNASPVNHDIRTCLCMPHSATCYWSYSVSMLSVCHWQLRLRDMNALRISCRQMQCMAITYRLLSPNGYWVCS